ncbi:hypothetical protein [Labilithrix luteola]|nr:hypothetical protein [Labilithrix luteola]
MTTTTTKTTRRLAIVLGVASLALFCALGACRGDGPPSEPRTPPNSPIPEVDRPEEPKPPLPNPFTDSGASAQPKTTTQTPR